MTQYIDMIVQMSRGKVNQHGPFAPKSVVRYRVSGGGLRGGSVGAEHGDN